MDSAPGCLPPLTNESKIASSSVQKRADRRRQSHDDLIEMATNNSVSTWSLGGEDDVLGDLETKLAHIQWRKHANAKKIRRALCHLQNSTCTAVGCYYYEINGVLPMIKLSDSSPIFRIFCLHMLFSRFHGRSIVQSRRQQIYKYPNEFNNKNLGTYRLKGGTFCSGQE